MTDLEALQINCARNMEDHRASLYARADEMLTKFVKDESSLPLVFMLDTPEHVDLLKEVNQRIGNTADEVGRVVLGKMLLNDEAKLVTLTSSIEEDQRNKIEVFDTFTPETKKADLVVGNLDSGLVVAEVLPDNLDDPCMVMYKLIHGY